MTREERQRAKADGVRVAQAELWAFVATSIPPASFLAGREQEVFGASYRSEMRRILKLARAKR